MEIIYAKPGDILDLGKQGEHKARKIVFDITEWHDKFGNDGVVTLIVRRPRDVILYPVSVLVSGDTAEWIVSLCDTELAGSYGKAELQYRIGDVVVKSAIWRTFIADSLGSPSPTPPEPQQAWVDQVLDAAQQVETATVSGPKIQDGTWWVWDFNSGTYVSTGVEAQGPDGPEGPPGPSATPVVIDLLSQYGVDVVSVVLQALSQGQTKITIPFSSANEFLAQVGSAVSDGKVVWLIFSWPGSTTLYYTKVSGISGIGNDVPWVNFEINVYNDGWFSGHIGIDQNTIYVNVTDAPGMGSLPLVTASNNGQFLRVVNGTWAAATVPQAEGGI